MIPFYLTHCTDCDTLDTALCSVEGALAQYGKDAWFNLTYLTQKPVPRHQISRLMYYKYILQQLESNQELYCSSYSLPFITSRAQNVAGSITPIAKRWKLPIYTTTTTTTTTSTSTTSTTTTTTSTSTSTTSTTTTTTTSTTTTTTTTP